MHAPGHWPKIVPLGQCTNVWLELEMLLDLLSVATALAETHLLGLDLFFLGTLRLFPDQV